MNDGVIRSVFLCLYNIYTHCLGRQQRFFMSFYMKLNIEKSKNVNIEILYISI